MVSCKFSLKSTHWRLDILQHLQKNSLKFVPTLGEKDDEWCNSDIYMVVPWKIGYPAKAGSPLVDHEPGALRPSQFPWFQSTDLTLPNSCLSGNWVSQSMSWFDSHQFSHLFRCTTTDLRYPSLLKKIDFRQGADLQPNISRQFVMYLSSPQAPKGKELSHLALCENPEDWEVYGTISRAWKAMIFSIIYHV